MFSGRCVGLFRQINPLSRTKLGAVSPHNSLAVVYRNIAIDLEHNLRCYLSIANM